MMSNVPRVADHDERRELIAGTFQRHVADHGLAATTFARVAQAAGISVGLIQHYFSGKDELLRFVYEDCLRHRDERIAAVISVGEADGRPIREMIDLALRELLPLDEQRRQEHHVTQNFLAQALHDPVIGGIAARTDHDLHQRLVVAVSNGKLCGEVEPDVGSDAAAARILAAVYGTATRVALVGDTAAEIADTLRPLIAQVFTGECQHHSAA